MKGDRWALGIDWGGTKVELAQVFSDGRIGKRLRQPTAASRGADAVIGGVEHAAQELLRGLEAGPVAVGVGIAGQVEAQTGKVRFAPNLGWHEVPLKERLQATIGAPVVVANDLRAITWGEWRHGAGRGCDDLLCIFLGTGIGGGVISGGRMLTGCSNIVAELGHMTVDLHGPQCHCGNHGCLEALAGGWAIARTARVLAQAKPAQARKLLSLVENDPQRLSARHVIQAARDHDELAQGVLDQATEALIAGLAGLVNILNPCRLILGGGLVEGLPELVAKAEHGIRHRALSAASERLEVVRSELQQDAGVIGAAAMAMDTGNEQ